MYVSNRMTANPYTLAPDATIAEALELMREKNIRRIPVMQNERLFGIITERKLLEVSPSPATTLSIFEINYLLSKTKIASVMSKDVITVEPDSLLEEALVKMREYDIGGLPVLEEDKLVGIITKNDIFDSFIEILGFKDVGSRIVIEVTQNRPGILSKIAGIIANYNVSITHLVVFGSELIIRINTINVEDILDAIQENGFKVISIIKNE